MAKQVRFQYAGPFYQVMARDDGVEMVFHRKVVPESPDQLTLLKKGDPRKVACAAAVKARTTVSNDWIAQRLSMRHPASMSQQVHRIRREVNDWKNIRKHLNPSIITQYIIRTCSRKPKATASQS